MVSSEVLARFVQKLHTYIRPQFTHYSMVSLEISHKNFSMVSPRVPARFV
jgi:hypothetical protein